MKLPDQRREKSAASGRRRIASLRQAAAAAARSTSAAGAVVGVLVTAATAMPLAAMPAMATLAALTSGCGAMRVEAPAAKHPAAGSSRLAALTYTAIISDSDGVSHFAPGRVDFDYDDFAPPAAPLGVSTVQATESLSFLTYPAGWYGDWHPAPRKLMVFILAGRVEVEVGDGDKRIFEPGDAILAADTTGRGHISRTIGETAAVSAAVAIREQPAPAR